MRKTLLLLFLLMVFTACAPAAQLEPLEITLTAVDIHFETTELEVMAGQPIHLTFINNGALEHDFSIEQIEVTDMAEVQTGGGHKHVGDDLHISAAPGQTSVLEFTPTRQGTYKFYCTVAGHKETGMVGQLVVK